MNLTSLIRVLLLLGLSVLKGEGQLTVELTPGILRAKPDSAVIISGVLSNKGGQDLLLNDLDLEFTGQPANNLTPITLSFFSSVPGVLGPGESYSGTLCSVRVPGGTNSSLNEGTLRIKGGPGMFALDILATVKLQLQVTQFVAKPFLRSNLRRTNDVEIRFESEPGYLCLIEKSTSLTNWLPWQTFVSTNSMMNFPRPRASSPGDKMFFRGSGPY